MKITDSKIIFFSFLLFVVLCSFYFSYPKWFKAFDYQFREYFFSFRGIVESTEHIVIVDIDQKSLEQFGQWPFSRDKMAQVLLNLTQSNAGIIGLDIVFAKPDRSSPHRMAKALNVQGNYPNYDQVLADVIGKTPTILGYFFTAQSNDNTPPSLHKPIEYFVHENLIRAKGVVSNIDTIQQASYSNGFFNAAPNVEGKIFEMPLIIGYQDRIYSSLSFEIIRIIRQAHTTMPQYYNQNLIGLWLDDFFIPTTPEGFLTVNFRGPQRTFPYISFADIYNNEFDRSTIAGKIVLIGTSLITLSDLRATVYDPVMPGVEIHANILDTILQGDFLYYPMNSVVIDTMIIALFTLLLTYFLIRLRPSVIFPLVLGLITVVITLYYYLFSLYGLMFSMVLPLMAISITTFAVVLMKYLQERSLALLIKDRFSKKVSQSVMEELLRQENTTAFKNQNRELTVFFSDLRDFTKISEKINDPEKLIALLNTYMEPMTQNIIQKKGTIDKFIGDAIMVYWNAPNSCLDHADQAVSCALNQLKSLDELNHTIQKDYNLTLHIGIGIHTGMCTVGEMGSIGRSDYTIIGDNVNLASRVEGLSKFFGVPLIITEQTKKQLKYEYHIREIGQVQVKGKTQITRLYEVLTSNSDDGILYDKVYRRALKYYQKGHVKKALEHFLRLHKEYPSLLLERYIKKCKLYLHNPLSDFDPIFHFDDK